MTQMVIGLQANAKAWDADKPKQVEKCTQCGTCYPDRYLGRANLEDGVCADCRDGK